MWRSISVETSTRSSFLSIIEYDLLFQDGDEVSNRFRHSVVALRQRLVDATDQVVSAVDMDDQELVGAVRYTHPWHLRRSKIVNKEKIMKHVQGKDNWHQVEANVGRINKKKKLLWTSFNSFQNRQKGYCFLKMKLLFFKKETSSKFMLAVDNNFYPLLSNSALEIAKKAANSK